MAAYNALKYGTMVLVGLGVGTAIFYGGSRKQVQAIDVIEIVEGLRERQYIVDVEPARTNVINLHISTNYLDMVALDSEIDAIITNFVNQEKLSSWASSGSTNHPDKWTRAELFAYLSIGNGSDYTKTPGSVSGTPTYGPYSIQVYKTALEERFKVLQALVYTSGNTEWGEDSIYYHASFSTNWNYAPYTNWEHAIATPLPMTNQSEAETMWATLEMDSLAQALDFYEEDITVSLELQCALGVADPPKNHGGAHPNYYWSYGGEVVANINFGSVYYYNDNPPFWSRYYSLQEYATGSWETRLLEVQLTGYGPSKDLTRVDMYYNGNALFESVDVEEETTSSHTLGYIGPASVSWGGETIEQTATMPSLSYYSDYPSQNRNLNKNTTNTTESSSGSYQSPLQVATRPVVHKWNVTRCVP